MARRYRTTIYHPLLNKSKTISASSYMSLQDKKTMQQLIWDEEWRRRVEDRQRKLSAEQEKRALREAKLKSEEETRLYAEKLTLQAESQQEMLDLIVIDRRIQKKIDAEKYKDYSAFSENEPLMPDLEEIPPAPSSSDSKYNPTPTFFTKLSRYRMDDFNRKNREVFESDYREWEQKKELIDSANSKLVSDYREAKEKWEKEQLEFIEEQIINNEEIDMAISGFRKGNVESVEKCYTLLLNDITLPFDFKMQTMVEYNPEEKRLIIEMLLPKLEDIPKLKSVSYVKSRREFKESYHTEAYLKKKYDSVIYQIVLVYLDQVFTIGSKYNLVDYVVINGRIDTIDKATGKWINPVVLSLAIKRDDFENINIELVDPKTWFRSAKGISAASIATMTAIKPIITMSHEDSRFVDGYEVVDHLDDGINLAAIDWQDFENLVREIFEKEFSYNGGEVKITQASRDGGVDAIAFDPDPLRGGKIVIQAKRYTNVVNVSAVRDLYGTVLNEGATKGILVTTSYYGNDSYSFAQGKPITLLDGSNLLYLLEKHGYKARIDLKEAKETQKQ